jgi:hypothetical protein
MIRSIGSGVAVGTLLFLGCKASSMPTNPSSPLPQQATLRDSASSNASQSASGTHAEKLTAVIGNGSGIVNVTPTAGVDGSFSAQINVAIHDAPPNTMFYVQRAPEIGRPDSADGICQRAAGEPPWGPPTPSFLTFPLPAGGPLLTLLTSAGGSGAVHIDFRAPTIPAGTRFDVMFRVVDDLTNPVNDLRTDCFTVTVK